MASAMPCLFSPVTPATMSHAAPIDHALDKLCLDVVE
jgi:hypothetical protein